MIKRYKTDLDSTIVKPKQYSQLPHPGLLIKNTESIFSLPLNRDNIEIIKSYQYNSTEIPHYWISDEQVKIKSDSFTTLVERDIKREVVRGFCNNFNEKEFNVRLLGVRFCDSSCFIDKNGQASTDPVVQQPSSLDGLATRRFRGLLCYCLHSGIFFRVYLLAILSFTIISIFYSCRRSIRVAP